MFEHVRECACNFFEENIEKESEGMRASVREGVRVVSERARTF